MKHLIMGTLWIIVAIAITFIMFCIFLWDFRFDKDDFKSLWNYSNFLELLS